MSERPVTKDEIGRSPGEVDGERVIAVVRNKTLRRFYDPTVATLEGGDQVVVVRQAAEEVEQQTISASRRNRARNRADVRASLRCRRLRDGDFCRPKQPLSRLAFC